MNLDYRTGMHTDGKNISGSLSALLILETGAPFAGGLYMLPQYRIGIAVRQGIALLHRSGDPDVGLHGNSQIHLPDAHSHRIAVVLYQTRLQPARQITSRFARELRLPPQVLAPVSNDKAPGATPAPAAEVPVPVAGALAAAAARGVVAPATPPRVPQDAVCAAADAPAAAGHAPAQARELPLSKAQTPPQPHFHLQAEHTAQRQIREPALAPSATSTPEAQSPQTPETQANSAAPSQTAEPVPKAFTDAAAMPGGPDAGSAHAVHAPASGCCDAAIAATATTIGTASQGAPAAAPRKDVAHAADATMTVTPRCSARDNQLKHTMAQDSIAAANDVAQQSDSAAPATAMPRAGSAGDTGAGQPGLPRDVCCASAGTAQPSTCCKGIGHGQLQPAQIKPQSSSSINHDASAAGGGAQHRNSLSPATGCVAEHDATAMLDNHIVDVPLVRNGTQHAGCSAVAAASAPASPATAQARPPQPQIADDPQQEALLAGLLPLLRQARAQGQLENVLQTLEPHMYALLAAAAHRCHVRQALTAHPQPGSAAPRAGAEQVAAEPPQSGAQEGVAVSGPVWHEGESWPWPSDVLLQIDQQRWDALAAAAAATLDASTNTTVPGARAVQPAANASDASRLQTGGERHRACRLVLESSASAGVHVQIVVQPPHTAPMRTAVAASEQGLPGVGSVQQYTAAPEYARAHNACA